MTVTALPDQRPETMLVSKFSSGLGLAETDPAVLYVIVAA